MKKCFIMFCGVPEWEMWENEEKVDERKLSLVIDNWKENIIDANPEVEFHCMFSMDSSHNVMSKEEFSRIFPEKKFTYPSYEKTLDYILDHFCLGDWNLKFTQDMQAKLKDLSLIEDWPYKKTATKMPVIQPNCMPYRRMIKAIKTFKADDYDYLLYLRSDLTIKKPVKLDELKDTMCIYMPKNGDGGCMIDSKDFDYMWAGETEPFLHFLDAWVGNRYIGIGEGIDLISHKESDEIQEKHNLWSLKKRPLTCELRRQLDSKHVRVYLEFERYAYGCIKHIEDMGFHFKTLENTCTINKNDSDDIDVEHLYNYYGIKYVGDSAPRELDRS